MASPNSPIVVVTGGNTGLGYETIKALMAEADYHIYLGSRSVSKGEDAVQKLKSEVPHSKSTVSVFQIDVASDESIEQAFEEISSKHDRIDALVNNAGANLGSEIQSGKYTTRQGVNMMWDVNVTGAHIMTETFMPLLLKSAAPRLVFITSGTSSLIETQEHEKMPQARLNASPEKGWPKPNESNAVTGYRSSKTGLNMLALQWDRVLKNDGVKVFVISPGFLATGLNALGRERLLKMGALEPHVGGEFVRDVVVGKQDERKGKLIRQDVDQPW